MVDKQQTDPSNCGSWLDHSGSKLSQRLSSYFAGQSAERTLEIPAGGVVEDQLFILLCSLRATYLSPGGSRTVPSLASLFYRRLAHCAATWTTAKIERLSRSESAIVPAGTFSCDVYYVVRAEDGRDGQFLVERLHPRRIMSWAWKPATKRGRGEGLDSGELAGSRQLEYWKLYGPGDERYVGRIGLGGARGDGVRGGLIRCGTPGRATYGQVGR